MELSVPGCTGRGPHTTTVRARRGEAIEYAMCDGAAAGVAQNGSGFR